MVLDGYPQCVPFIEEKNGDIFLKTTLKSRKRKKGGKMDKNEVSVSRVTTKNARPSPGCPARRTHPPRREMITPANMRALPRSSRSPKVSPRTSHPATAAKIVSMLSRSAARFAGMPFCPEI